MRDTRPYGAWPCRGNRRWRAGRLGRILRATQTDLQPMSVDANAGNDVFDRILSASGPLVALKTSDTALLVEQFRLVARRTGQAVYLWRHAEGLVSLRDAQMRVPGCLRLGRRPALYLAEPAFRGVPPRHARRGAERHRRCTFTAAFAGADRACPSCRPRRRKPEPAGHVRK